MSGTFEAGGGGPPLRVIQCFRAPLGGLFRHVVDLSRGLAARGVQVGVLCDTRETGELERRRLEALTAECALGVHRTPMPRHAGLADISATVALRRLATELQADILHGHGAKGGAYARVAARLAKVPGIYTPHGGALHYTSTTPSGFVYLTLERLLRRLGGPVLFESEHAFRIYAVSVGAPPALSRVVHNGLASAEFEPVKPAAEATDVVFIGELRTLKGPFVLVDALARLAAAGRHVTATIIGRGPDEGRLHSTIPPALAGAITFVEPMPAREGFRRGRFLVVPSLAESLPYIVLEAAAAAVPMVATDVGGIPEIFGPLAGSLVKPGDAAGLAAAIHAALDDPEGARNTALQLCGRIASGFSMDGMVDAILATYRTALARAGAPSSQE